MFKISQAKREKVKLMIGLTGPSGAGKTTAALKIAHGITGDWTKVYVADTENKSALYYAGEKTGDWNHIPFESTIQNGYQPQNWVTLINEVEKIPTAQVLILDSITHEWDACLELQTKLGGRYTDWAKITPLHNAFINKMRDSRLHIIATMRSKQEYVLETNDKGKPMPKKVGLKSNQREGLDYEFGIIFDIQMNHLALASKDRTGLFASNEIGIDLNQATGRKLVEWANAGVAPVVFEPSNDKHMEWVVKKLEEKKLPADMQFEFIQYFTGIPFTEFASMYDKFVAENGKV